MYETLDKSRALQNYLCWNVESDRIICLTINIYKSSLSGLGILGNPYFGIVQFFKGLGVKLYRELLGLNLRILRRIPVRARIVF